MNELQTQIDELNARLDAFGSYDTIAYEDFRAIQARLPKFLFGTAKLDFANTLATSASTQTVTVYGAKPGDCVCLGLNGDTISGNYGLWFFAYVSAQDTVTISFQNFTGNPNNPTSQTFNVVVIQQ